MSTGRVKARTAAIAVGQIIIILPRRSLINLNVRQVVYYYTQCGTMGMRDESITHEKL
jgi:hypothetical protein